MIVEFKPKKRPSVGSKKCKPYVNQDCYLRRKEYRKCRNLHWRLQRAETKEKYPSQVTDKLSITYCYIEYTLP